MYIMLHSSLGPFIIFHVWTIMIYPSNGTPLTAMRRIDEILILDLNGLHLKICATVISGMLMPDVKSANGKTIYDRMVCGNGLCGFAAFMLGGLSQQGNFTYDVIFDMPVGETFYTFKPTGHCDMYIRGNIQEESIRYYFLHPFMHVEIKMLIPMPEPLTMNLDAVWKPFQPYVWLILLTVALPMAAFGLALVDYKESGDGAGDFKTFLKNYTQYTIQILLSQGGNATPSIKWKLRLAVGAWLLSAFVLITAYSSVLFSFILAPHFQPLIKNVQELAERNDVNPVFVKANAAERLVMTSPDSILKQITAKITTTPANRVPNITSCMDFVKKKKDRNVCVDTLNQFFVEIKRDYEKTGQCLFYLVNDNNIGGWYNSIMVDKGSPLKEVLNNEILRMVNGGLFLKARDLLVGTNYRHCSDVADAILSGGLNDGNIPLSLGNLTGPFVILLVGYALAIWTLIIETIAYFTFKARKGTIHI